MTDRKKDPFVLNTPMAVALSLGFGFLVLIAMGTVLTVGLWTANRNTNQLTEQRAELLVDATEARVRQFLNVAEDQIAFIGQMIEDSRVTPGHEEDYVSLLIGSLAANPQITAVHFMDRDLRIWGAERRGGQGVPFFANLSRDPDIQALAQQLSQDGRAMWGDLFWREEYGEAFINLRRPILIDGYWAGTLTALVSVKALSQFLSDMDQDLGQNAFVLYGSERVLAHPLMAFGYPGLTRQTPLPLLSRYTDVVLATFHESLSDQEGAGLIQGDDAFGSPHGTTVSIGEASYRVLYRTMTGYGEQPLIVGGYVPDEVWSAELNRLKWAGGFGLFLLLLGVGLAAWAGKRIAQPVRRLAEGARAVRNLDLAEVRPIPGSLFLELRDAAMAFNAMLSTVRWFERYVPKRLVRHFLMEGDLPDNELREVTILFTDISGFTALVEKLDAHETARFLNAHFALLESHVHATNGTVDKFMGDSMMAFWGAPDRSSDHAVRALTTARAILKDMAALNAARKEQGEPEVFMRLGLHTGRALVGAIGGTDRVTYTVVGDTVNIARRMEGLCRDVFGGAGLGMSGPIADKNDPSGTIGLCPEQLAPWVSEDQPRRSGVLASGETVAAAGEAAQDFRAICAVTVRGRTSPTQVFGPEALMITP